MAESTRKIPLIAVDSNVLIDRAGDHELAFDALDTLARRIRFVQFVVTPTVIEEIAQQYPSSARSEADAVLAHLLRNRDAVSEYLAERSKMAEGVRTSHALRLDGADLRKGLLARRKD